MNDIEDLMNNESISENRSKEKRIALIKKNFKLNQRKNKAFDTEGLQERVENVGLIPGSQKVYVKTFGCSHNVSDSEFMMGQLVDYGYELVQDPLAADLILINSCTVKNPSQEALMRMVFDSKDIKKPVVVAGCVTQGEKSIRGLENVSIVGVTQIDRVVEVVEETLKGHSVQLLEKKDLPSLDLPKIRKNRLIEIVAVNVGCLGNCTYCKTKHARGHLGSYHPDDVVRRILKACEEGAQEVWLTSEDTGAYGRDIGTSITELLVAILRKLPRNVMLRIGMTNPPYILEHLEAMAVVLNHPQVFGFLHLPVQSGSNTVLERMNREYTREDFETVADYLRKHVGEFSLSTDFICGFPGESDSEHRESVTLIEKYHFDMMNISQFYPRPGTIAAKMKPVDSKVKKSRSTECTQLFNQYKNTDRHLGRSEPVWFSEEEDFKGSRLLVGHTKDYTKVVHQFREGLLGQCVMMRIDKCSKWHVEGTVLEESRLVCEVDNSRLEMLILKENPSKVEAIFASNLSEMTTSEKHEQKVSEVVDEPQPPHKQLSDQANNLNNFLLVLAFMIGLVGLVLKARNY